MSTDTLTLILAPLAVGFLLLYLQQLGKIKEFRVEAEAKRERVEQLVAQLKESSEQFEEALRVARNRYDESDDAKSSQVDWALRYIRALEDLIRAMADISAKNTPAHLKGLPTILSGAADKKGE